MPLTSEFFNQWVQNPQLVNNDQWIGTQNVKYRPLGSYPDWLWVWAISLAFFPLHIQLSVHYLQTRVTSWQSSVLPQAVQVKHSTWEIHFRINPRDFCLSINTYFLFLSIVSGITSNILQNSSLVKWYSWFLGVKIWKLNLKKIEWI